MPIFYYLDTVFYLFIMNFLRKPLSLSFISVILLSLPWLGAGGFGIFAGFVPMLAIRDIRPRKFLWWVSLTLFLWIMATCYWVSFATIIATFAVPIVGLCFMMPGWILFHFVAKIAKPVLAYIILVCGVVVFEWLYALGDVSFPWLTLGSAFAREPFAVQWYSITGVYGGSVWILIANLMIYTAIKKRAVVWSAAGWIALPIIASLAMYWSYDEPAGSVEVAVIQPNVDPYTEKFSTAPYLQTANLLELASGAPGSTALFVAPETALVAAVNLGNLEGDNLVVMVQDFLKSRPTNATFVIGATTYSGDTVFNSALFIDTAAVKVYHKSRLVMGVEVVPEWMAGILESIDLGGYVGSLGRQKERTVYNQAGAAICYESIYGEYFAEWVANGAQFMLVITNDGWWRDTPGYKQHFAQSRLRALESRRAIARSANTGISAVILPNGDVEQSLGWDERAIICASIPKNDAITIYVESGDYVVRLAIYILALSLLYAVGIRYRRKV